MPALSRLLNELRLAARRLDGAQPARTMTLLRQVARTAPDSIEPRTLAACHDLLLFIAAFPADARMAVLAEQALGRIATMARTLDARALRSLAGSGIAGTSINYAWGLDGMHWLTRRFPGDVTFIRCAHSLGEAFDEALAHIALPIEFDGLVDTRLSVTQWLDLARAGQDEVAWVTAAFIRLREHGRIDPNVIDRVFDALDLRVRWRVRDARASRTLCRFPARRLFEHAPQGRAPRAAPAAAQTIDTPLPANRPLSMRQSRDLIDIARCALATRCRETDPVTHADPRDVALHRLHRGVDVLLMGMSPRRRLPIEGYFGYMAAKNRIPIAYGGGWIAFDTCTIGINLFESFRGGESSHIFAQILRVYRWAFAVRRFRVDPYQFGQDNEEAIRSGAFWFYYRMGFRPTDPQLLEVAQREARRIADDRAYRSGPAVLRRLAGDQLQMLLGSDDAARQPAVDLGAASLAVTRWIARRFAGDRNRATTAAIRRVQSALRIADRARWPVDQQAAFESLAILLALIPDLARWSDRDRASLVHIIRAKGGKRECDYVRALRRHRRLHLAIARVAADFNAAEPRPRNHSPAPGRVARTLPRS